jgi:hypothetical protein
MEINEFNNCSDCIHEPICNLSSEYQRTMDELEKQLNINDGFRLDLTCKHFMSKLGKSIR